MQICRKAMSNMYDIKIGSRVKIRRSKYKRDENGKCIDVGEIVTYEVVDIFFEAYMGGFKTVIKVKDIVGEGEIAIVYTFYVNDFFEKLVIDDEYTCPI